MKTAAINKKIRQQQAKGKNGLEQIQVFCRVRPLVNIDDPVCLRIIPPSYIQLIPPTTSIRNASGRETYYAFKEVLDDKASQKAVFDRIALSSVENTLCGKNSLIFTYGVTGSGKTYTMTGHPQDGGIMPRCLDVIFNSISKWQAQKRIFKPDRMNSFDIQTDEDAKADRDNDLCLKISSSNRNRFKLEKKDSDPDLALRVRDEGFISTVDDDNLFAVFVTYVEIYNNSVYDLLDDLDDGPRPKPLQSKIIREDVSHNMYVHGVNEIEVSSTDEAFEIYYRGQKRKRIAQTTLNSESSRSHSVFTVRIVQAPLEESGDKLSHDKSNMLVSQLSLVDLAGSERSSRTKNTGQRLREAGNINNSLLTLRTCLELLRDNQNGANKIIPYRDSRLTHLFKNFFEGEGQVSMIICVSPHEDDYDEVLHVLKFAEMSQDVQIAMPVVVKSTCFTPGRRKAYEAYERLIKENEKREYNGSGDNGQPPILVDDNRSTPTNRIPDDNHAVVSDHWFSNYPDVRFIEMTDDKTIPHVVKLVEAGRNFSEGLLTAIKDRCTNAKKNLVKLEKDAFISQQELHTVKGLLEMEKEKNLNLENKVSNSDTQLLKMKRKADECDMTIKRLKKELSEKELLINRNKLYNEKAKENFTKKMVQTTEKLNREHERRLRSQKSALEYEMRNKENKLLAVKRIVVSNENLNGEGNGKRKIAKTSSLESLSDVPKDPLQQKPKPPSQTVEPAPSSVSSVFSRPTSRKMGVAVSNRRHRRSRSAGNDVWLDHRPQNQVPPGTLMQPSMAKKKSVTKLTDAKDVTESASKYCLMTQTQDSDGDLETRLYKGDVIPTCGGGAQVMFNDVEVLRQYSPTRPSPFKRPGGQIKSSEAECRELKRAKI